MGESPRYIDSSWTLSKRHRTGSRRAKRKGDKSLYSCLDSACGNSTRFDMPVSELNKCGGALSVAEKAELVPIKKRRFLFRSPSPPRIASPQKEESAKPVQGQDCQDQSAAVSSTPSVSESVNRSSLEPNASYRNFNEVCESLECKEDLSGISILATAACSTNLEKELDNAGHDSGMMKPEVIEGQPEENTVRHTNDPVSDDINEEDHQVSSMIVPSSSDVTTAPIEKAPSPCMRDELSDIEKNINKSQIADSGQALLCDSVCKDGDAVGSQKQNSQDVRLHWDLNVVMDAWEPPFGDSDYHTSEFESSGARKNENIMGNTDLLVKPAKSKFDDEKVSCEPARLVDQGSKQSTDNHCVTSSDKKQPLDVCQKSPTISSDCNNNVSLLVKDKPIFSQDPSAGSCHSELEDEKDVLVSKRIDMDGAVPGSVDLKNITSSCLSVDSRSVAVRDTDLIHNARGSTVANAEMSPTGSPGSVIFRKSSVVGASRSECIVQKEECSEEGNNADLAIPVSHDGDDPTAVVDMELSSGGSIDTICYSEKNKEKADGAAQGSIMEVHTDPTTSFNRSFRINYDEFMKLSDKRKVVDTSGRKSNRIIPSERYSTLGSESESEPLDGYDSQYEDGELREPSRREWEEYEGLEGEAQHAEYGLTDMDIASPYNTGDCEDKVASPHVSQIDGELTPSSRLMMEDNVEDNLISKTSGDEGMRSMAPDELSGIERDSSAPETIARDDGGRVRIFSRAGRLTGFDGAELNPRTRGLGRVLPSQIDGPVSREVSFRGERMGGRGSRWERDPGYRGRFLRRPRFYMQGQSKTGHDDGCVGYSDGRRGFRRQYSPTYRVQSNLDSADAIEEGKSATLDPAPYIDQDDFVADGDRGTGFQPCSTPNEELSSTRPMGRGRFLRYGPQMDHRAGRGRYNGPYQDDYQPPMKYRRPMSRRERSDSPGAGRGGCTPNYPPMRGRSPSRSRTRSPDLRTSPKGRFGPGNYRDTYLRNRSRSPNFRSDMRMMRRRSPNLQTGFMNDRARVRPLRRDQMWVCDRKDEAFDFRDPGYKHRDNVLDRSPGRARFHGAFDGARNSRPDVFYRSPPVRLSEAEGANRGGFRADEQYENRRKQFGPPYSSRRGLEHGNGRRLRHNDDDVGGHFVQSYRNAAEFRGRGMRNYDNRMEDMPPRRFRREQRFMYEQDGKFDADSKPFRFDRGDTLRNMKSGEHHRSFRPGRFGEMDGADRGNRYMENYEDRRKRHGLSHPFRNDEMESAGKRLDHGADDDMMGELYSCNQDDPDSHHSSDGKGIGHLDRDLPARGIEKELDTPVQDVKLEDDLSKLTSGAPGVDEDEVVKRENLS